MTYDIYADCVSLSECVDLLMDVVQLQSGETNSEVVKLYIERAYYSICNYLYCDELPRRLVSAAGALAPVLIGHSSKATKGYVASQTQGSRSISYSYDGVELDEFGFTAEVKAMLPMPRMRCF